MHNSRKKLLTLMSPIKI